MLDLTVVRQKDKAEFVGIWLRPRSQPPISFSDATRARIARDVIGDQAVTREYLIANGTKDPIFLYTTEVSECGVGRALNAATQETAGDGAQITASFGPCELKAWWGP